MRFQVPERGIALREARAEELIAEGEWYGMQTFDQSLFSLYKNNQVTLPAAMAAASNPHDFRLSLQQAGLVHEAGTRQATGPRLRR